VASIAAAADPPRRHFTVTWDAPAPLARLFRDNLPPPEILEGQRRFTALRPWMRDVRRRVPEMAAAEGWFSASVDIEIADDREGVHVTVTPGARTTVADVTIDFIGDIATESVERAARRSVLREAWGLQPGAILRSADWEDAKRRLEEKLVEEDYAAGRISSSEARVDAQAARATLHVVLDSGPPFTLGETTVEGLQRYDEALVRRNVDWKRGDRYRLARLTALQRALQNAPWFASVVVDVDRDPAKAAEVPVKVTVVERPSIEVGVALGYGTDSGARAEVAFRDRNLFARGWDLQSSARVDRDRQIGYADVYLPPFVSGARSYPTRDSFGVLAEHTDIEDLQTRRVAVAGYRQWTLDTIETRCGLSYQVEQQLPAGAAQTVTRALAPVANLTWRHVDNFFDPTRGVVLNLQLAAGSKPLGSTQDFIKTYAQAQVWIPLGENDQILVRGEIGKTFASSKDGIPQDFVFRAGGSRSNRGYAYQSLGVQEGSAIVGGRFLGTMNVDYVHWFSSQWGGAVFYDMGTAADTSRDWDAVRSYGLGARYRTTAGPLALDLAYADRDRKFRIAFSVTVAF